MVTTEQIMGETFVANPFNMDGISNMHFFYVAYTNEWVSIVEFKNNNTTGKQEFRESGPDALQKVIEKVRNFLNYLESVA
jgi:hypothetical protein